MTTPLPAPPIARSILPSDCLDFSFTARSATAGSPVNPALYSPPAPRRVAGLCGVSSWQSVRSSACVRLAAPFILSLWGTDENKRRSSNAISCLKRSPVEAAAHSCRPAHAPLPRTVPTTPVAGVLRQSFPGEYPTLICRWVMLYGAFMLAPWLPPCQPQGSGCSPTFRRRR